MPLLIASLLMGCSSEKGPDTSAIKLDLSVERFDRDFFNLDSNKLNTELPVLLKKYPTLLPIFTEHILGVGRLTTDNPNLMPGIKNYLALNRSIFDSTSLVFKNTDHLKKDLEKAFKYVKYYFPNYPVSKIALLVGPVDAMAELNGELTPNFIGPDFIGISLQFYLGSNFSVYQNEYFIINIAPLYRSRRFEKEYMVSDVMKLIADDIFPDKSKGKSLIEQMIIKGKQWYMMEQFMPYAPDSIMTGYTQQQVEWCKENEGLIWNYLITNEDLYSIEQLAIQTYIGESPSTQGMPERSPGNIGPWIGLQIIRKFAAKNVSMSMTELLNTDYRKIMEEAKYKPK